MTGNRPVPNNWSDNSNLPGGWSNDGNLPEHWNNNSNLPGGWNEDNNLPVGWMSNSRIEGWGYNTSPPDGRMVSRHHEDDPPGGYTDTNNSGSPDHDNNLPEGWKSNQRTRSNNIMIKRNNNYLLASHLPTIFVTNHRSFFPKFKNFTEVMQTLNLTLGLHSEVWEDRENKAHKDKLEGIQYISNTRPDRRGGGAAISLISGEFTLTRLGVLIPKNLAVVWGHVKPKHPTNLFKGIIVCSFYSVPNSKRKTQLIEHITINYTELKTKHKDCYFLTGGDKNELETKNILDISPTLHMHNTKPTHGKKNIDVLISDMVHLYSESVVIPNVPTDIPDGKPGGGKCSDHKIVYCEPRLVAAAKPSRRMVLKKTRRITNEKKRKLALWIQHESWKEMYDSNSMAEAFMDIVDREINKICPIEEVKISQLEGKVNSLALQKLVRQKKREYEKHGCSKRFKDLKKKVKDRIKKEAEKAIDKLLETAEEKGMKWIKDANRLSARPGEDGSSSFSLPNHVDANFSPKESAEAIAEYFSKISLEFTPIEEDKSARWMDVQKTMEQASCSHPVIYEHEIFENMKAAKKTDSVPGDIPSSILKEFLPEFASPVASIIKEAIETHTWPAIFKKEYHIPIKKVPSPQSEDDVRGIGLTTWVSKQLERVVLKWIWPYLKSHIDPDQMGGVPGGSVEHYIIKMLNFILSSMDRNPDTAVLSVPVDYQKAFNRMLHSDILCNLAALNVPTCAVKLIKSYLTGRSMCVRYMGEESSFKRLPGGGPQGGLLTGLLFVVQVNKAGRPCSPLPSIRQNCTLPPTDDSQEPEQPANQQHRVPIPDGSETPSLRHDKANQPANNNHGPEMPALRENQVPLPPCHSQDKLHKKSFVDDLTLLEKISLKKLKLKERIIGPLNFHDRFSLELLACDSILQHQLEDLKVYTLEHSMKLNSQKTKCMPYNNSKTKDFMPQLKLEEDSFLEVIYEIKLVGLVLTSDLRWNSHINYTVSRVNKVIWQLVRFKQLGAPRDKLRTLYILKIRSILMFGSVCYHSALTLELSKKLEMQQKRSLAVILGAEYRSYSDALILLNLPRLDNLRESASLKWAIKSQQHPRHSDLFKYNTNNTRRKATFIEPFCRTTKYYKSAIPSMTRALNQHFRNTTTSP